MSDTHKSIDVLDNIVNDYYENEGSVISVLQQVQAEYNYLPEDAINYLSEKLNIPASSFYGVATFYSQFYLTPRGKNIITLCCGTACHVKGSEKLINRIKEDLSLHGNEETSADGLFTLEKVACVGACSIAPVAIINKKVHGHSTISKLLKQLKNLKEVESGKGN
ncbi:NADH dehydrogenase (Ubiquinone) 24 kDa subunit [Candidatus Magnetoovum chiemensis]|nr:NADH dehydrogenase (Ubiquinone) 24 kDa subunit [Candidatus Magnetoovum chiemensis]